MKIRTMNWILFVAAVLICESCAMGCPMLLGEPEIQEGSDSSDGPVEEQIPLISNEEPVNVVQMKQEGNAMAKEITAEPSSELQQPLVETMQPPKGETVQSASPISMQLDQSDMMMSDQTSAENVEPQQTILCPPSSDCPEKEIEDQTSNVAQSPPAAAAAASDISQTKAKPVVVLEPGDKKTDKFEIASPSA